MRKKMKEKKKGFYEYEASNSTKLLQFSYKIKISYFVESLKLKGVIV